MKTTAISMVMAALICAAQAQKQEPPSDPLSKHLVKPSLIFSKAEAIGLSSEQHDQIRTVVEKAHGEIGASQKALRPAYAALESELAESPVDIEAATQQLDKVLDLERGMKRLHLRMLAEANNLLSTEQRAKLRAMNLSQAAKSKREPAEITEKRLKGKIAQLKKVAEALAARGESPAHIHEMMKVFTNHMEKGQVEQAETLLDAKLRELGAGDAEPEIEQGAVDADELKKEIAEMRVKDVAWRKIEWKTCLLDGIKASREQKKPMVLWVFIDRPVDDKRC